MDSSLALVNLAMAAVAHLRSSTALRTQLGDLLEAQRAGIVRDVTSFLTPGADGTWDRSASRSTRCSASP